MGAKGYFGEPSGSSPGLQKCMSDSILMVYNKGRKKRVVSQEITYVYNNGVGAKRK